ncbi:hypothetical protein FIBSPDRAFT_815986 [Athelia psychrophila]|uniref:Uncharacterized protein n=1 Tax=Athelia psychrophila TaxID=1759441 RepID=A0A166SHP1_9AGAM|nr:hypothetical protein FIBSPDRAFT_815986 [Fibularhizoctonia sp. CBS 109695]
MSAKSASDFESFMKASDVAEHMMILMATVLEVRDGLEAQKAVDEWRVPNQLKANIKVYSHAFVLSPLINSYRGKASESLLEAMRELEIAEIPPTKETGQVKILITSISSTLTGQRNVLKTKISDSLKPESPTRNIAALANAVIGKSRIKPTLQLYIRLAFIRFHVVNYPSIEDENFWIRVDQTMEDWRSASLTAVEITQAYNNMYSADKELYGDPATSSFRVTDISLLEGWQLVMNTYSSSVAAGLGKRKRV